MIRLILSAATLAICFGVASGPVSAASCCVGLRMHFAPLGNADFDRLNAAATTVVNSRSVGKLAVWSNPVSGDSGTVQFILRYASQRRECRKLWFINKILEKPEEHWEINACLVEGTWALSQPPKSLR